MSIAGVQEQLRAVDRLDELTGSRKVLDRPLVVLHHVDLEGDSGRPGSAELGGRESGAEEQRSLGTWSRLGQLLCCHDSEREPGIDELVRQAGRREPAALLNRPEANLLRVADALVEVGEGLAVVEVGRVNDVAGGSQFVREREEALSLALGMMEEQDLGHGALRTTLEDPETPPGQAFR